MMKPWLALGAICIIWGTTYAAIKVGVQEFPPYLMAAGRQVLAGVLMLLLVASSRKWKDVDLRYLGIQFVIGILAITGGNGLVSWGMQYISSGLSAVIGSLVPIMVVVITAFSATRERLRALEVVGIVVGFMGMALIFSDSFADFLRAEYRMGIIAIFTACFSWSLATVLSRRYNRTDISPLQNGGIQIFSGGLGLFVMSFFFDSSYSNLDLQSISFKAWGAFWYLTIFGSAIAFTLYMYVLKHLTASTASIYTYINPIVAILVGWLFLDEKFNLLQGMGVLVTMVGVYLVNRSNQKKR